MKKILFLIIGIFMSMSTFSQDYNAIDSLELAIADSACTRILLAYKTNSIYTRSKLVDGFKYTNIENLTKCHLAYYSVKKSLADGIYDLELWFEKSDNSLILFNSRFFMERGIIEQIEDFFIIGDYKKKYPNVRNWEQIRKSHINIGMTKEECILSIGRPNDINRTVLPNVVQEQWIYDYLYVYFRGNRISSFQD